MYQDEDSFTVIGEVQEEELIDQGRGGAGDVGAYDVVLFQEISPDSWELGEEVGSGHATYVITPRGLAILTLTLRFGDEETEDSITASGAVPHDGGLRDGILAVTGGTGRFRNRGSQVRFSVKNPHKYRIE